MPSTPTCFPFRTFYAFFSRRDPIVTEIADAATFYPAEKYHQQYFERNGGQPYCQFVVAPKVAKFRKEFADRLKR